MIKSFEGLTSLVKSWIDLYREHSQANIIAVFVDGKIEVDVPGMWIIGHGRIRHWVNTLEVLTKTMDGKIKSPATEFDWCSYTSPLPDEESNWLRSSLPTKMDWGTLSEYQYRKHQDHVTWCPPGDNSAFGSCGMLVCTTFQPFPKNSIEDFVQHPKYHLEVLGQWESYQTEADLLWNEQRVEGEFASRIPILL